VVGDDSVPHTHRARRFGDLVPTSPLGRLATSIMLFVGVLTIALPISILTSRFPLEYELYERRRLARAAKLKKRIALAINSTFGLRRGRPARAAGAAAEGGGDSPRSGGDGSGGLAAGTGMVESGDTGMGSGAAGKPSRSRAATAAGAEARTSGHGAAGRCAPGTAADGRFALDDAGGAAVGLVDDSPSDSASVSSTAPSTPTGGAPAHVLRLPADISALEALPSPLSLQSAPFDRSAWPMVPHPSPGSLRSEPHPTHSPLRDSLRLRGLLPPTEADGVRAALMRRRSTIAGTATNHHAAAAAAATAAGGAGVAGAFGSSLPSFGSWRRLNVGATVASSGLQAPAPAVAHALYQRRSVRLLAVAEGDAPSAAEGEREGDDASVGARDDALPANGDDGSSVTHDGHSMPAASSAAPSVHVHRGRGGEAPPRAGARRGPVRSNSTSSVLSVDSTVSGNPMYRSGLGALWAGGAGGSVGGVSGGGVAGLDEGDLADLLVALVEEAAAQRAVLTGLSARLDRLIATLEQQQQQGDRRRPPLSSGEGGGRAGAVGRPRGATSGGVLRGGTHG
jgi:hypothetical protein